jgi:hypothetical protein
MCLAPSACETELVPQTKRRFTLLRYQGFALSHDEVLQAHLPWGTLPVLLHVPGICASFPPKLCIFPACIQPGQSPFQRAPVVTASFPGDSQQPGYWVYPAACYTISRGAQGTRSSYPGPGRQPGPSEAHAVGKGIVL